MEIEAVPEPSEALLVAHRSGEPHAFRELVSRYRRPVYGYLVRCSVSEADRDDLFQEIFIKIHQRAHQYDASRPLHPWLFTVVANTVRTYQRKERVRRIFVRPPEEHDSESIADGAPDGEALFAAKETKSWLERAIRALPVPQREALVLATIEKLPLQDIASALDMPLSTVKTHVRRARLRLIEAYERRTRARHD